MRRVVFGALLLLAACSVEPPVELEKDPGLVGGVKVEGVTFALAPVSLSYLRKGETLFAPAASVSSATAAEESYAWDTPPADGAELQHHFARLLELALGSPVAKIGRGSVPTSGGGEEGALEAATCEAADLARAQLLVHVDVLENRIAWKSRKLEFWVPNLVLLWGGGVIPVLWVPDEDYEAHVKVRLTVVHARTRERLFQGEYEGSVAMALNTFQRGLTISGLIGLHPYFLSTESGDYDAPHEGLFPQALRDLDQKIAHALPASLVEALGVPANVKLVHDGTAQTARTYAIVVGHNGPSATRPRPPLRFAANDAEAVGQALVKTGVVRSRDDLRVLTEESAGHASRTELLAAIDELVPRMLGLDRLISYSGYGKTTNAGEQALVLGGDAVTVAELGDRVGRAVLAGHKPRVVFLLDTSFGSEPVGKDYPDERAGAATGYLEPLANRSLGWTVIAAAGPGEAAFEIDARSEGSRHGFFTQRLLALLAEREGPVTTDDLAAYLAELVPEDVRAAEQAEQTPERRGLDAAVLLGFVKH